MVIRVDGPQIKIVMLKTTGINFNTGQSYRGAASGFDEIELTGFLGDAGSVNTMKALDEPCGGFSISFADRCSDVGMDTVYALAEPMDMIEIRMSRIPVGIGADPPLVMRGYISSIRRVEAISGDGVPQRAVVIQGHDSGKLWQNHSILPEAQMAGALNTMLSTYFLNAVTGIQFSVHPVSDFIQIFTDEVMNVAVDNMSAFAGRAIPRFVPICTVPIGRVSAAILQGFTGGKFWDVLEYVADRPWNELFIQDPLDGGPPELIFRPVPYLDVNGAIIMEGAVEPEIIVQDIGEIVSMDAVRSDHRTANFFWVPAGASQADTGLMTSIRAISAAAGGALGPPLFSIDHDNSALALYGLRKMEHGTRLMPSEMTEQRSANMHTPANRIAAGGITTGWHIQRANELRLLNEDNVVWETIEIKLKGYELFRIGFMLEWTRGQFRGQGLVSKGYITRCAHQWVPLKSGTGAGWITTLTIERSNGFLNRDAMGESPYWGEGRRGPYDPTS